MNIIFISTHLLMVLCGATICYFEAIPNSDSNESFDRKASDSIKQEDLTTCNTDKYCLPFFTNKIHRDLLI